MSEIERNWVFEQAKKYLNKIVKATNTTFSNEESMFLVVDTTVQDGYIIGKDENNVPRSIKVENITFIQGESNER